MKYELIDLLGVEEFVFFGCSFTSVEHSSTGYQFTNFRKLLENKFNTKSYTNYSQVGLSNQEIIDRIYWNIKLKNIEKPHRTLFVIQTTFLDRLGLYYDLEDKFISICKNDNADSFKEKILIDFYNDWLKYFYSRKNALLEFQKQIDLICRYLDSIDAKYILIGTDESLDLIENENFFLRNNFLKFDKTYSFYGYCIFNKLRIADIIESNDKDFHFNQTGHDLLTEKIINKLTND